MNQASDMFVFQSFAIFRKNLKVDNFFKSIKNKTRQNLYGMHCFVDLSTSFCVSGIILKIEIQHKLFQFCHQFFYTSGSILKKEIQHKLFQRRGAAGGGGGLPSYAGLS